MRHEGDAREWLGTEDAARDLGMTPQWVRRQVSCGRIGATIYVTGRRSTIRIRRSALEAFLAAHALHAPGIQGASEGR